MPIICIGNVTLTVDQTYIVIGNGIHAQLEVSGDSPDYRPDVQTSNNATVLFRGQQSKMQIINGDFNRSTVYTYQIQPVQQGHDVIGPVKVIIDGKEVQSNTINIVVGQADKNKPSNQYAFLEATISNTSPYLHEQIIYQLKFYYRVDVMGSELSQPEFKGFWKESLGDPKQYQVIRNGQRWNVSEINWALFPNQVGANRIEKLQLNASLRLPSKSRRQKRMQSLFNDSFFSNMNDVTSKVFFADAIDITVKELPENDQPEHFSGLVGQIELTHVVDDSEVNESGIVSVSTAISGIGNLMDLMDITFSEIEGAKVYADKPTLEQKISEKGLWSKKTFKKAIVLSRAGEIIIPSITLNYFDPKIAQYVEKNTLTRVVKRTAVLDSDKHVAQTILKKQQAYVQDIMPMMQNSDYLIPFKIHRTTTIIYCVVIIACFFSMGICIVSRYRRKHSPDAVIMKKRHAYKSAMRSIKKSSPMQDMTYVKEIAMIMQIYLSDRLNHSSIAISSDDIENILANSSVSDELQLKLKSWFLWIEKIIYGGQVDSDVHKIMNEMQRLLSQLDKEISV